MMVEPTAGVPPGVGPSQVVPQHTEPISVFALERPYLIPDGRNPAKDLKLLGDSTLEVLSVDMSSTGQAKSFTVAKAFPMLTKVENVFDTAFHRVVQDLSLIHI